MKVYEAIAVTLDEDGEIDGIHAVGFDQADQYFLAAKDERQARDLLIAKHASDYEGDIGVDFDFLIRPFK